MATTYTLISSNTVGSTPAASFTFSSIPSTYTDLKVVVSARVNYGDIGMNLLVQLNSSTTGYTSRQIFATGSNRFSYIGVNDAQYVNDSGSTANTFCNTEIYIPNYTSANFKSSSADSAVENNATTAYLSLTANLLSNTAAVSSINFAAAGGSFVQHSTFYLYGIKNS